MNSADDVKIWVLIITYNKFDSLKRCLGRILRQRKYIANIVVVNNCSTDDTEAYLNGLGDKITALHLDKNYGGAGGYYNGLKYCVENGADWIWCVENDIFSSLNFARNFKQFATSNREAMQQVGFLYPTVYSILSRRHVDGGIYLNFPHTKYLNKFLIAKAQFAGCILSAAAIKKAGLPIKEFFIYYDDWEHTMRLAKHGYKGLWLDNFFVWHNDDVIKPAKAYINARKKDVWKYFYGIRNELYITRLEMPVYYTKQLLVNLFYIPLVILLKRKEDKIYVATNWFLWSLKSLFFRRKQE